MKLPSRMHQSWEPVMAPLISDPRFRDIKRFLAKETFLPQPPDLVFNAFQMELNRLRVVIIGQDPYPSNKNAHGLSFSIPDHNRPFSEWPPSLQVIAKDICGEDEQYVEHWFDPNLESWMMQGVLLINKALTIGKTSHIAEWEWFTEGLIKELNNLSQPIIFYFLGSAARKMARLVTSDTHYIFDSIHPASLAYDPNRVFNGKFHEIGKLYHELHGFQLHYILPF